MSDPGPSSNRFVAAIPSPAELATVLAAQRLEVTGAEPTRWFGLPDVQVLAANPTPPTPASAR